MSGAAAAGVVLGALGTAAGLGGCERKPAGNGSGGAAGSGAGGGTKELVVYCSADSVYAEPIFAAFTKQTGITVKPVFDTEATKTTGLVNRLLTEKDTPRADVWWSSEPFGTIRLARAGVLAPYTSAAAEAAMKPHGGWPAHLRGKDGLWYGFGGRARVFVYNTKMVKAVDVPRRASDLLRPVFKGRVGMARPQFGTTRGHMAAILALRGPAWALKGWLRELKAGGVRLYDGNAAVVRAVGTGEVHVGLTDSDDVFAGQREGWPVELAYEWSGARDVAPVFADGEKDLPAAAFPPGVAMGVVVLPNTVGKVHGGPNAALAGELIDFLLTPAAQRALAESDSHNMPVDPALAKEFAKWGPNPAEIAEMNYEQVADMMDEAIALCDEVLG